MGGEPSRVGSVVASKYRLDEELGRGGMGAVYRAFHLRVHKEFALKVLLSDALEHRSIASRFFMEAQAAGRIGHPGILDVYDVGEDDDGTPFIVMELLRGEPLAVLLRRSKLDVDAACWIATSLLDILDAAHRASVVHRDVKPQNVFVVAAADGTRSIKLLDFGIAKFADIDASAVTRSGEVIGSPLYMAPEQAKGESDVDARVDVWSVGALLFEMLTGTAAHSATSPVAVIAKILTERAPAPSSREPSVPPELDAICQRALEIDRASRFASARAMADALEDVRVKRGTAKVVPALPPPSTRVTSDALPGEVTSTIEAKPDRRARTPGSRSPAPATWQEPSLEAAVTNDASPPRRKWVAIAAAVAAIAAAAIAPWFVPGWSQRPSAGGAGPSSPLSLDPGAAPSGVHAETAPSATVPASVSVLVEAVPPPKSTVSAPLIQVSAPASPPRPKAVGGSEPAPTKPSCAAGESLSLGHCCPRGLVWEKDHCERPLATSF